MRQQLGWSRLSKRIRAYLADYVLVLGDARWKLRLIVAQMLVLAALDLVGVGLVAPFAQVLTTGTVALPIPALDQQPRLTFLLLGLALIAVFLVKSIVGYRLSFRIVTFSAGYRADLIHRLMAAYQSQTWQFHVGRNTSEQRIISPTEATVAGAAAMITLEGYTASPPGT